MEVLELAPVPLVLGASPGDALVEDDPAEVLDHDAVAPAEDLEALLGAAWTPAGRIRDRRDRAVGVAHGDDEVVLEQPLTSSRAHGEDLGGGRPDDGRAGVEEMAHLAEQASAFASIVVPVAIREPSGVDPVGEHERSTPLTEVLACGTDCRRVSPVEPDGQLRCAPTPRLG